MAFHDVSLPDDFEYQSVSGAGFNTVVQTTSSGHEFRVSRNAQGRHRFRLRKSLQTAAEAAAIKEFALSRRGSLHSFRLKDWADYSTASDGKSAPSGDDVIIGTGDGSETVFPLIKVYDNGGYAPYQRTLSLPIDSTVVVTLDGVATTNFTVSASGEVVMNAAPTTGQVIRAGCEFDVPVRFEAAVGEFTQLSADGFDTWGIPSLDCIEVLDEVEVPERWFAGGATEHGAVSTTQLLRLNGGMLQSYAPTTAVNLYLPVTARIPGGGQLFVIHCDSAAAGSLQLVDEDGDNIGSAITAGNTATVGLLRGATTATWVVY